MRSKPLLPLLLAAGLAGGLLANHDAAARLRYVTDADAPRALAAAGPVDVRWDDPANFAEIRYSSNRIESRRGDWVEQLARHVRDYAAPRLPAGERLEVTLTDVDLAGDYEPWRGPQFLDTRFLRDIYPPRISLQFTRTDANGTVIAQGERKLRDPGYLIGTSLVSNDPLKYEERMLERWLARELPAPARSVSTR
ncbi:DUF3016 domain-containing protein [Lysobacter solisilvae (ex Woo and Kim 2020)]|uniref:DUF3016 domain-containing protein n=1 Tax=Agrilutibacter terrestris TaxID=2865112 RepID=A0A7H0G063_9GAMM|nr:DUF3016 domain-containing protein [Lysobacter terrestris]QNP41679.1 DUF3016 domain-containing protein [Lysobacter terrestris]